MGNNIVIFMIYAFAALTIAIMAKKADSHIIRSDKKSLVLPQFYMKVVIWLILNIIFNALIFILREENLLIAMSLTFAIVFAPTIIWWICYFSGQYSKK